MPSPSSRESTGDPIRGLCGCPETLGRQLLRYAPMVRAICAQQLGCHQCDDLQQEAFLRVLRTCDRVRNIRHLPAYLRAITRNLCSDHIRARRSSARVGQLDEEVLHALPNRHSNERDEEIDHQFRDLRQQLRELPEQLRSVVELFYFSEMDYAQIACRTGLTTGAVGQRLSRARRRLRQKLVG